MRTLEHHTLLYDEDCPLCKVYTSGFIKTGMLDNNGRKPFSTISPSEQSYIDMNRASNEIALVDTKRKTVIYGIDSLLKVIGYRFPLIEKMGHLKPIKFLLKRLYSFISYNRKVIIPSNEDNPNRLQCLPSFNVVYRILYILLAVTVTSFTLFHFSKYIFTFQHNSIINESTITIGQLIFQVAFIYKLDHKQILNYIGNLMTVSLLGSMMLIALLIINTINPLHEIILLSGFGITVVTMFIEHFRRIKLLKLPFILTYTWILYRLPVLLIILILNS